MQLLKKSSIAWSSIFFSLFLSDLVADKIWHHEPKQVSEKDDCEDLISDIYDKLYMSPEEEVKICQLYAQKKDQDFFIELFKCADRHGQFYLKPQISYLFTQCTIVDVVDSDSDSELGENMSLS